MSMNWINDRALGIAAPRRPSRPLDALVTRLAFALALGASACSGEDVGDAELDVGFEAGASGLGDSVGSAEPLDTALAAEIAESKRAAIGPEAFGPDVEKHAGCGTSGPTGSSERNDDAPSSGAANQRSGSSTGCAALGVLQPSDDALYYCFTAANDGFTWTYNQNLRTGVRGWTRDDLLDDRGSFTHCGF